MAQRRRKFCITHIYITEWHNEEGSSAPPSWCGCVFTEQYCFQSGEITSDFVLKRGTC